MKWCFLVNQIDILIEFLGKLSCQALKEGDDCLLIFNSKIAEYTKRKFFPKEIKTISKVDWLAKNYKKDFQNFGDLSWKELFPTFDRKSKFLKLDYDNSTKIVLQLCQFFDFVFRTEKPNLVINEAPANIFSEIAYHYSKKFGITYLGFIGSRLPKRVDIYDREYTCSRYERDFKEIDERSISQDERIFIQNFIKNFLSHRKLPPYMDYQMRLSGFGVGRYLKREGKISRHRLEYLSNRKHFEYFDYESESLLKYNLWYPFNALKRKLRALSYQKIFNYLNNNDKFFLFPLHLQPEASTSVLATYFYDQLNSVRNAAFSLPLPYKLYVKEHPSAIGTRPGDFYRKLREIPNVVLISPFENVENLIKKSQGVITLTSTVGLEAALAGKPVYVLGNVFYSYHPLCRKVNSFKELKQKIQMDLDKKPAVNDLENINIPFVFSYFKNTLPGDIDEALEKNDKNNYKEIYQAIKKMFLEYKK